jgi:Tfp pilus assembly protein PilF
MVNMERIDKLKALLADAPNDSFLQHALALEYVKIGDDAAARNYFENLLHHNESYVGSYYHLAKLLERADARQDAIRWYEKGMLKAKEAGDQHALSELRSAYEDLLDE